MSQIIGDPVTVVISKALARYYGFHGWFNLFVVLLEIVIVAILVIGLTKNKKSKRWVDDTNLPVKITVVFLFLTSILIVLIFYLDEIHSIEKPTEILLEFFVSSLSAIFFVYVGFQIYIEQKNYDSKYENSIELSKKYLQEAIRVANEINYQILDLERILVRTRIVSKNPSVSKAVFIEILNSKDEKSRQFLIDKVYATLTKMERVQFEKHLFRNDVLDKYVLRFDDLFQDLILEIMSFVESLRVVVHANNIKDESEYAELNRQNEMIENLFKKLKVYYDCLNPFLLESYKNLGDLNKLETMAKEKLEEPLQKSLILD
jgi:hypothetical protein